MTLLVLFAPKGRDFRYCCSDLGIIEEEDVGERADFVMAEKPQPVRVLYCQVCSMPAEYCEFGPDFEKCKPWLVENAPHVYPDITKGKIT